MFYNCVNILWSKKKQKYDCLYINKQDQFVVQ